MTRVILEAGEKFTNPPLIGVQEAVRSDVQLFAGGITWVDAEYDERLGEVLRPLTQDKSGLNFGMDLRADIQMVMREAFFLNKIEMPAKPQEMTAYEVAQRVQEYIRQALPLFEPMEHDYNGSLCENTFGIMLRAGAFGPLDTIPRQLRNRDVKFKFSSPLQQALDSENMAKLQQSKAALSMIADIDPNAAHIFDAKRAFRDALRGARVPSTWVRSEREVDAIEEAVTQENEAEMQLSALAQSATAAKDLAAAKLSNSQAQAA